LQDRLGGDNDPRYATMIYNECLASLPELMVNLFGTYLCQKLMECCSQVQRTALWRRLRGDLISIGCDRQGSVRHDSLFARSYRIASHLRCCFVLVISASFNE
jgi:hypothetical protein